MRYWEENSEGQKEPVEKQITKQSVINTLEYIKRGYMPDWNYERGSKVSKEETLSLPNEYYPLHVAMQIAIKAVEEKGADFFKKLDEEYGKRDKKGDIS